MKTAIWGEIFSQENTPEGTYKSSIFSNKQVSGRNGEIHFSHIYSQK